MNLSRQDIEHIAHLARIRLAEAELAKFEHDLSAVLTFVAALNELDTADVLPMTGGTLEKNSMRDDTAVADDLEGNAETLLGAFPEEKDDYLSVRSVFT